MPRDGNGNYTLPAGNPVVTATTISSTVQNNTENDLAAAITASLAADGQTSPTADLKMAGFRHKNVANASSRISTNSSYASAADVQDGSITYLTGPAGTNTVTASAPLGLAAYVTGQRFVFVPAVINTGATTLNVNSIGAKNVFLNGAALVAGELQLVPVEVEYDGTQFNILANSAYSSGIPGKQGADVASAGTLNLDTTTGDLIDVTGTTTITAVTLSQGRKRFVRFTGALTLTNGASLVLPGGANITTVAGDYAIFAGYSAGVVRCLNYIRGTTYLKQPTSQIFTSGTAATYTTPANVVRIRVRMVGGGGGGGASNTNGGQSGTNTTFSTFTASGGTGGATSAGAGGAGGAAAGGTINIPGGAGQGGATSTTASTFMPGGQGGSSVFGGAGPGGPGNNAPAIAAATNSGGGGGGAGGPTASSSGGGGGSGGYVEAFINSPATTYTYTVGPGGNGGAAGAVAGGNGATGIIIVEEFYA